MPRVALAPTTRADAAELIRGNLDSRDGSLDIALTAARSGKPVEVFQIAAADKSNWLAESWRHDWWSNPYCG